VRREDILLVMAVEASTGTQMPTQYGFVICAHGGKSSVSGYWHQTAGKMGAMPVLSRSLLMGEERTRTVDDFRGLG